MTIKVKLRKKPISGNRQSLYLDFYPPIPHPETGEQTRREFLGLYIYEKPKTPIDKAHNEETFTLAKSIRQKRENSLNKPEIYSEFEKEQLKIRENGEKDFVAYFQMLANKRKSSNHDNWVSALNYLTNYTGGKLKFADINESWCEGFKEYLQTVKSNKSDKTTLATNSAVSYFNKIKASLRQAFKDGILQIDINAKIDPIKPAETRRNFLTIEELNSLVKTPCKDEQLKKAALFSALTGLRFSDIEKLVWREIEFIEGQGFFINFTQQKTEGVEVLPISEQAFGLLGERCEDSAKVFQNLEYSAIMNKNLAVWIVAAGITKEITFHCFRHTYATLQLANGTDLYTVSKMLGHRDIKTTQIYAKIVDASKRKAADKIKLDL
jgi:integrase